MGWLHLVNCVGIVISGAYGGFIGSERGIPYLPFSAAGLFLVALALPFIIEYRSVHKNFRKIESSFLDRRRPLGSARPGNDVQIFTDEAPDPVWQAKGPPVKRVLVLTLLAVFLLSFDVARYVATLPPADERGTITNY